jgi:predicted nucleic acid-binding protein
MLAPDIFPVEVANTFFSAEAKGAIAPGQFAARLADVMLSGPVLYQSTALLPRACLIIRRATARIAIYDCLYVALAEREGCELITSDTKLIRALRHAYPFITDLATIP